MSNIKIVHEAGGYVVQEIVRHACKACVTGWNDGTIRRPKDGGPKCIHGTGEWMVGQLGKRGGWYGLGPRLGSEAAAVLLCDALATALAMPPQGVR